MYQYFTRFQPDDDKRFWFYNSMHFPEPMPAFDTITGEVPYQAIGANTARLFVFPTTLGIEHRIVNGRVYITANPVLDPAEIERRAAEFGPRAGYFFENWNSLYEGSKSRLRALIAEIESIIGGNTALNQLSFNVRRGETRVIMGAAGSGKTVLLKTAMGLIHPAAGRVFLFDEDVTNKAEVELFDIRSKLGMLFQESALFDSMTVAQNVAYPLLNQKAIVIPRDQMEPAVRKSLSFVELEQTMDKYPSELSGGMRRRVAIARAVVTNPPLLLYDSPTAGLDPITAHTIMALIVKERDANNTTALVVTHRYQDGNLVANFRYNPNSGRLDPVGTGGGRTKTIFMVMKEGRLVFEGDQTELEACLGFVCVEVCETARTGSSVNDMASQQRVEWAKLKTGILATVAMVIAAVLIFLLTGKAPCSSGRRCSRPSWRIPPAWRRTRRCG